jgi:hypothetical protein
MNQRTAKRMQDLEGRIARLEGMVEQIMRGVNDIKEHVLLMELEDEHPPPPH